MLEHNSLTYSVWLTYSLFGDVLRSPDVSSVGAAPTCTHDTQLVTPAMCVCVCRLGHSSHSMAPPSQANTSFDRGMFQSGLVPASLGVASGPVSGIADA